jgi:hypothetical protein
MAFFLALRELGYRVASLVTLDEDPGIALTVA